jgi:hypothetical protein
MRLLYVLGVALPLLAAFAAACGDDENQNPNLRKGGTSSNGDSGLVVPGGDLADEKFPAALLAPYTGPPIDNYDNTAVGYVQLKARVMRVFADTAIGGDTNAFIAAKIALLGGADFVTHFSEARVVTPDFLLALDGIAKTACARAAANKTGPFAGADPGTDAPGGPPGLVTQLYNQMLFRPPSSQEVTDTVGLYNQLVPLSTSKTDAWAGICEALVRHPDSIFTLPPSVTAVSGADKERLQLVKLANDLVGRPPSVDEMTSLAGKAVNDKIDHYVSLPEFRDFYMHRVRLRTESLGTPESDEPARLWTYLVVNGAPMQDLLKADYTVDANLQKIARDPVHGTTGLLTMPGYIKTKPGLPHYNYAARVMTDFMGQIFEVPPSIVAMRIPGAVASTVQPGSVCITCHGVLTPLATQRLRWADDGTYRTNDANGPIDDSDRNLVPDYPFKGQGMGAFAVQAVKKEMFFRQTFQSQFLFFMGRQMRYDQDERTVYLALWLKAFATNGDLREVIKIIANVPSYLGQ